MKKIAFLFFLLISVSAFSQFGTSTNANSGRLRAGGGMAMSFGNNNFFAFSVMPQIGYMLTPQVEAGMLVGYQHTSWTGESIDLFSVGPYLHYFPIPFLFLRTSYEYFTGTHKIRGLGSFQYDEDALWLGGGYSTGGRVQFFVGAEYNVLWNKNSMFPNGFRPFMMVSVGF